MSESALRVFVEQTDARCPACAYSLSGLTGETCPECGVSLRLSLVRSGRGWAWIHGVIGLGLGLGLMVVVLIAMTWNIVLGAWHREPMAAAVVGVCLLACALQALLLARWIARSENPSPGRAMGAWGITTGVLGALWLVGYVLAAIA